MWVSEKRPVMADSTCKKQLPAYGHMISSQVMMVHENLFVLKKVVIHCDEVQ